MITTPKHHAQMLAAAGRLNDNLAEAILLHHSKNYKDGMGQPWVQAYSDSLEYLEEAVELDALAQTHTSETTLWPHLNDKTRLHYELERLVSDVFTVYQSWGFDTNSCDKQAIIDVCEQYLRAKLN